MAPQTNNLQPKHKQIQQTLRETRNRRKDMVCRTYELKVNRSKLSKTALRHLHLLFLEAKWYSNAILASQDMFAFDYKTKVVPVKTPAGREDRTLQVLSSQMRQELLDQIRQDVISLAKKKAKGWKIGRLKCKKRVEMVPLKQHTNTYTIQRPNKVRIQGLRRWVQVRGLDQIPADAEFAASKLLFRTGDFYVHVTTYLPAFHSHKRQVPSASTGIDGGIAHQLTLSNGVQITYDIPIPGRIKRLYQVLSKKQYGSKNYVKPLRQLRRAFGQWTNQKQDVVHKRIFKWERK